MLRVRPIHFTSNLEQWTRLLTLLGMVRTADDGEWQEFDAGSGRLALRWADPGSAQDGTTVFGVEVGDLDEFARRTNEAAVEAEGAAGSQGAGSPADEAMAALVDADHGRSCRIRARDGFSFFADPAAHGANCADADPALTVVAVWFTEDTEGAASTLRSIGARPRPVPDNDETADFTAKNGGVLMVRPGTAPGRAGLGFEYGGDLDGLRAQIESAGWDVAATEEAFGRTLQVPSPDAEGSAAHHPPLWISGPRRGV
ncbi:VOC family protein [Arthrobacter rhizosphaerae]|uniref:VOC family protein n=1 Tax=Arthrobacter rhizosphaerae TaxID=2855490 RepID=UPI001FF257BB